MSYNFSPKIVTDGLVLYLDAANTKSYPGSGTIWTDLSSGGNVGSFVGSPTFNSSNLGNIAFDGTDYVNFGTRVTDSVRGGSFFTISYWIKKNGSGLDSMVGSWFHATRNGFFIEWATDGNIYFGNSLGVGAVNNNITPLSYTNNWYYLVGVFDGTQSTNANKGKIYVNGQLSSLTMAGLNTTTVSSTSTINFWVGSLEGYGGYTNGNIASVQLYNRALSSQEVLQNYNATKSRFGLK
jgi:hypothetical protein